MKVLWIGGWGTSPEWGMTVVERWRPHWQHEWVSPGPGCSKRADGSHDWVGGYSFGAFLMLQCLEDFPAQQGQFFVAPFLDLKREADMGGLVPLVQLEVTLRNLQRNPLSALNDFYQRAGLKIQLKDQLPYNKEDLLWGLDELLGESAPTPKGDPGMAIFGEDDPLIDAPMAKSFFPQNIVVAGAGHLLEDLRGALTL